mgnify:CR=1 FL=1
MLDIIRILYISKTIPEEYIDDMIRAFRRCLGSGAKPEKLHHTKNMLYALRAGRSQRIIYTRNQAIPTGILVLDFLANHEYQKINHDPSRYKKSIKEPNLTDDFTTYTLFPDDARAGLVVFSDATHHPTSVQPQKVLTMHQIQALDTLYAQKPSISVIQGPAGSGKSMLMPWLFACLHQPGKKLFLAPSNELALQQQKRLQAFLHHHDDFKPYLDTIDFCFLDAKTSPTNKILSLSGDTRHCILSRIPDHDLQNWCQHRCKQMQPETMPSSNDLEHLLTSLDIKMQTMTHTKDLTNEAWHALEHELREQYPEATERMAPGRITAYYQQYIKHRKEIQWRSEEDDARWFRQQRDLQHQDNKLFSERDRASLMQVLHLLDALPTSMHHGFITTSHFTCAQQERLPYLLASYRSYQDAHQLRNITAQDAMAIVSTYPIIVMDEWLQHIPIGYQLAYAVQQKNHPASPHQTHRLFLLGDITQAKIPFPLQTVLSPLTTQNKADDPVCITLQDSHRTPIVITALCQRILYEIHGRIGANLGALPTLHACNQTMGWVHIVRHQQRDAVARLAQRIQQQFLDTLCIVHTQTQADWLIKLLAEHIQEDEVLIQIVKTPSDIAGLEFANIILLDDVLSQLPFPEHFLQATQTTPLSHKHKNKHVTHAQLQYIYALRTLYLHISRALSSLSIVSTQKTHAPTRKWLDCIEQIAQQTTQTPHPTATSLLPTLSTPDVTADEKPRASNDPKDPNVHPKTLSAASAQILPIQSATSLQHTCNSQRVSASSAHTEKNTATDPKERAPFGTTHAPEASAANTPTPHAKDVPSGITHALEASSAAQEHAFAHHAHHPNACATSCHATDAEHMLKHDDLGIDDDQTTQDPSDENTKTLARIRDFLNVNASDSNIHKLIKKYQIDILHKEKQKVKDSYAHYVSVIKSIHKASDLDLNAPTLQSILQAESEELERFEDFLRQLAAGSVDPTTVPKHVKPDIWQRNHTLDDAIAYHVSTEQQASTQTFIGAFKNTTSWVKAPSDLYHFF